jgi:hypothetical protein
MECRGSLDSYGSVATSMARGQFKELPALGEVLLYAGGPSEPELLIPYGQCVFNSKFGVLYGNHFLTIVNNREGLAEFGKRILWEGAKDCTIELIREA